MKTKTKLMTAGGLILAAMLLACTDDEAEAGKMNDAATKRAAALDEAAKLIQP